MIDTGVEDGRIVAWEILGDEQCNGDYGMLDLNGLRLTGYHQHGFEEGGESSAFPAQDVKLHRDDSACEGETWGVEATGSAGDWDATGNNNTLTNCYGATSTECGYADPDSCSGVYEFFMDRDDEEPECEVYDPIELQLATEDIGARRAVNPNANCSPGSGRFQLLAMRGRDRDHDDNYRVTLLPVMISGSGTMTNAAWVTEIDLVEDQGNTLKVVKPNENIIWEGNDHLHISTETYILGGENPFDEEEVSGHPIFVVEEVDPDDVGEMQVDMTWTCDTAPGVSQTQGYVIPLNTIGCSLPQKLVMRTYGAPLKVAFEEYGNPNYSWVVPTTPATGDDRAFTVTIGRLEISGVIQSQDSEEIEVDLTNIVWDSMGICDEDTYVFEAE